MIAYLDLLFLRGRICWEQRDYWERIGRWDMKEKLTKTMQFSAGRYVPEFIRVQDERHRSRFLWAECVGKASDLKIA